MDLLLLTLALYFIQEGEAQRTASKDLIFYVDFPQNLLPLAYAAAILILPNLAITAFSLIRNLYRRRWPWVTTLIAAILLGVITADIGIDGVKQVINPGS